MNQIAASTRLNWVERHARLRGMLCIASRPMLRIASRPMLRIASRPMLRIA
jgi:hypothetical protein